MQCTSAMIRDWLEKRLKLDGNHTTERLALTYGRGFDLVERPKGYRLRRPHQCFHNSLVLALDEQGDYCEGFARVDGGYPFHHAWVAAGNDSAIEVTLRDPRKCVFFGVRFPLPVLRTLISEGEGKYGFLGAACDTELLGRLLDPSLNDQGQRHTTSHLG